MSAALLSYVVDTSSLWASLTSGSYDLSIPFPAMVHGSGRDIAVLLWLSTHA